MATSEGGGLKPTKSFLLGFLIWVFAAADRLPLGAGRFPILRLVRPESNRFAERTVPEGCFRHAVRPFRRSDGRSGAELRHS